jgi:23S rRNA pseudouridine1911/1915/1917 synthase
VFKKKFLITPYYESQRLDIFLSERIKELSRSHIQRLIEEGKVKINGRPTKSSRRLKAEEKIEIEYEHPVSGKVQPENIPIKIIYKDDHLLVVDKPSGMVVHPGAKINRGTLVNALLHRFPHLQGIGPSDRPAIVHRLDKETSGVMVVARSLKGYKNLQGQFKKREVTKIYIGLVWGRMPQKEGKITWSIGRHPKHGERISLKTNKPRSAKTYYTVEKEFRGTTLLRIRPVTGRTHQIRVHLAAAGHPIVGDSRYGHKKPKFKCPRLFLHALELSFLHPDSGETVEFSSPLPRELKSFLNKMESL